MAYDKKLLAAARRELERERTAHTEELEARRRDIYTREPRIRAIDRELSTTAASVLRAAMESGGDPTAAIEKLRDRNLGLQEERGNLLRQQVGVDDHGALSHQAVVDQVVQRGNRKGSTHFGAHIVDNEQVGALVACSAFCGGFAVAGAEFDGLIRGHNVDGGVVGHGKSACRDRLGNAGREKGLAQTGRAEQQQIGGILAEFCGISLAFAQIIFHIFAR